jgi:ERCC4-type nuclease
MIHEMHIAYDSREQHPLHVIPVHCRSAVSYHRAALQTFDYCVWGDWEPTTGETVIPHWAIERKSMEDFIGAWFNAENRRREMAKIARAESWLPRPTIYVCEFAMEHLAVYDYNRFPSGGITARTVASCIDRLRYSGIQVVLAGSRHLAEYTILSLLKRRISEMSIRHWRRVWTDIVV